VDKKVLTAKEEESILGLVEEFIRAPRGYKGWAVWAELIRYIARLKRQKTQIQIPRRGRTRRSRPV